MSRTATSPPTPRKAIERRWLDALFRRYHHRRYVSPDPLEFLYAYTNEADREIVGLVASSLAYGNVRAMRPAIQHVLDGIGPHPAAAVAEADGRRWRRRFHGFRYRFTTDRQLAGLLTAAGTIVQSHGRLEGCLENADAVDTRPALASFARAISAASPVPLDHLVPDPQRKSACKRLNLYLRWMVRQDEVDPGGWRSLRPAQLIMPLDTHVFQSARRRGWTTRRTPNLTTALEITSFLRTIAPDDPLRYDFALTRPGIRGERDRMAPP